MQTSVSIQPRVSPPKIVRRALHLTIRMSGFLIYSTEVSSASAARASEFEKRVATQSGKQLDRARAAGRDFAGVISEVEG